MDQKDATLKTYAQHYCKFAALLDLVVIDKVGRNSHIEVSDLGKVIYNLDDDQRDNLIKKLLLRIPILRECASVNINYEAFKTLLKKLLV